MIGVEAHHPDYTRERQAEWKLCRDAYEGESAIKAASELYLPKPGGFAAMKGNGTEAYRAYRMRAQFPDIMAASVGAMIGIIHDKEIQIELPEGLEYLREDADGEGATLDDFHRRVTRELLVMGRHGVLTDAPADGGDPYLTCYTAPTIINWDEDWFVLDESHMARDGFDWKKVKQHRLLEVSDGRYRQVVYVDGAETEEIFPGGLGGRSLAYVPFIVAGAKDLGANVETPPLIGVARAALAMYQLSADWRHQLFMSGQETLLVINGDAPSAVGAGVVHVMKGSTDAPPDMRYVSPSCSGIDRHEKAIEMNRDAAVQSGARLFEQSKQQQESGAARSMRFRSETANLQTVADASCACLERALRFAADMKGLPWESVTVTPPDDLLDATLTPAEGEALWRLVQAGGMSWETYYENLAKGGLMSASRDADEEFALIDDREFSDTQGREAV